MRALWYFDGRADADLAHIGLLIGGIITRVYDRKGLRRMSSEDPPK